MAAGSARPGELIQGINVTPLVDVVLVLLIILMVTAKYAATQALPMELPKAQTGETSASDPIAIAVAADGTLHCQGARVSKEELRARLRSETERELPAGTRRERSALIAADGAVAHRAVVGVIDLLRSEGITKFAINVAPEDLAQ